MNTVALTREQRALIDEARVEWDMDGVLSVATHIRLENAGLSAAAVIEHFTHHEEI